MNIVSEDVISRQAAIEAVEITPFDDYGDYMRARELIENLPSVKFCMNFCTNCGAKIESEK